MAVAFFGRALIPKSSLALIISRSYTATSLSIPRFSLSSTSSYPLLRLRPLVALTEFRRFPSSVSLRCFATRPTASSLNDPNPNWSNRPPKETILLDGCDFEHWLVVLEKPEGEPTRDEIIDSYIKTLAMVVGSEEEARMKIYSVSTRHYFAFGALVSEELSLKIKELPRVRWVLPDSYLDVKNKDYGGEPFIDGQAVPYDPKYHEEWVRNNARANERNRRNDRPRNFDRSRNFERRRENMQNRDFQSREMPPMPNRDMQNPVPNMSNVPPPSQGLQNNIPNMGGIPPNQGMPNMGGVPPNQGMPNVGGVPPNQGIQNTIPNIGGIPPNQGVQNTIPNMGRMPPNQGTQMGGMPPTQANAGYTNNMPYRDAGPNPGYSNNMPYRDSGSNAGYSNNMNNMSYRDSGSNAGYSNNMSNNMPYRDAGPNSGYSNNMPNRDAGMNPGYANNAPNRDFQNRDVPPSGGIPYQGIPNSAVPNRDYQNSYIPNRDVGGGMQGGNQSQVRDLPGRDMPPGPNRDY